jgi:predicted NBD/HSP70 family sugar kinase
MNSSTLRRNVGEGPIHLGERPPPQGSPGDFRLGQTGYAQCDKHVTAGSEARFSYASLGRCPYPRTSEPPSVPYWCQMRTSISRMAETRATDLSYYLVRVPHYVLVHGAQLAAGPKSGGLTQEKVWEAVGANRGHVGRAVQRLRADGYLSSGAPLSFGPEMGGVVGVSLGKESLRAGWFDANGSMRVKYEGGSVPERFTRQRAEKTLDEVAEAVNAVLDQAISLADSEHEKDARGDASQPLFVERDIDGTRRRVLPLLGVAVAWPVAINRYTMEPEDQALHDSWGRQSLTERLADRLGLRVRHVRALNDANAAAIGTTFDEVRAINAVTDRRKRSRPAMPAYESTRTALLLRVSGGIGAGIMIVGDYDPRRFSAFNNATLVEAEFGAAGEIGHVVVDQESLDLINDPRRRGQLPELGSEWICSCGERGHLEAFASATALARRADGVSDIDLLAELGLARGTGPRDPNRMYDAIRRIEEDDHHPVLDRALKDMGRLIGHALAGSVLMLAPSSITLTGSAACDPVLAGFVSGLAERGAVVNEKKVRIQCLRSDNNRFGPARGAALSAFRDVIYRNVDEFARLYEKAGERHLPAGERLFSTRMRYVLRTELPLRPLRRG